VAIAVATAGALVGALIGGGATYLAQTQGLRHINRREEFKEQRDAAAQFLAAIRDFRRYVMVSYMQLQVISRTSTSRGAVIVPGRQSYDQRLNNAVARLPVATDDPGLLSATEELRVGLNEFVEKRAQYGLGQIPDDIVKELVDSEKAFAALVRDHLSHESR